MINSKHLKRCIRLSCLLLPFSCDTSAHASVLLQEMGLLTRTISRSLFRAPRAASAVTLWDSSRHNRGHHRLQVTQASDETTLTGQNPWNHHHNLIEPEAYPEVHTRILPPVQRQTSLLSFGWLLRPFTTTSTIPTSFRTTPLHNSRRFFSSSSSLGNISQMQPGIFHESDEQEEYMSSRVQEASDDIKQPVKLKDLVQEQCPEYFNGKDMLDVHRSLTNELKRIGRFDGVTPKPLDPSKTREEVEEYVRANCYKTIAEFCQKNGVNESITNQLVTAAKNLLDQSELIDEINEEGWGFSKELEFNRDAVEDLNSAIGRWRRAEIDLLRQKITVDPAIFLERLMVPLYNIDLLIDSLNSEL
mgnify:CR=1 FL=1